MKVVHIHHKAYRVKNHQEPSIFTRINSQCSHPVATRLSLDLFVKQYIAPEGSIVVLQGGAASYELPNGHLLVHTPQMVILVPRAEGVVQLLPQQQLSLNHRIFVMNIIIK